MNAGGEKNSLKNLVCRSTYDGILARLCVLKGFVEEVVILCRGEEIARHPRSYGTGVFVADPLPYLALIASKPIALDEAAALQGWDLPEAFQHLRHLL